MTFLAPALAFGAALAAVPIIIHLLNQRRYRRVPWAAMEFLLDAAVRSRKRLRLEELILMLLRAAAVALFAFALARPLLSASGPSTGAEAVILVDRSASMRYSEGAGTLFEFAKARVHDILSGLGAGGKAVVATFDSGAQFPLGVEPTTDLASARQAIEQSSPGWSGTDYAAALSAAAEASRGFASRAPAVYIVSDFRRGAATVPPGLASRIPGGIHLVPVTDADGEDLGITSVAPAGQVFTTSADLLSARVTSSMPRRSTAAVSIVVDNGQQETTPVAVDAGSSVAALITATALSLPGAHRVTASVAADAYPGDDRAYGVVVRRPLKIVVSASGEAGLFISSALASAPQGSFDIVSSSPGGPLREVERADGLIFAGALPAGKAAEAVAERIRAGAFAVVFLAPGGGAKEFFAAAGAGAFEDGLDDTSLAGDFKPALAGSHAVTDFVKASQDLSLSAVSLKRVAAFAPAGEGVTVPIVVETPRGKEAFLAFARAGGGKLAAFNTALTRDSGGFAVSPFFVPLLYETLSFLAGDPSAALNVQCGSPAAVPAGPGSGDVDVEGPDGRLKARLEATPGGFAHVFVPDAPGFYTVGGVDVAANAPASEAVLALAARSDLERAFGGNVVTGNVASSVERGARGVEISMPLLMAALAALALEMLAVYAFKRGA